MYIVYICIYMYICIVVLYFSPACYLFYLHFCGPPQAVTACQQGVDGPMPMPLLIAGH